MGVATGRFVVHDNMDGMNAQVAWLFGAA